jgi:hypothetical protein
VTLEDQWEPWLIKGRQILAERTKSTVRKAQPRAAEPERKEVPCPEHLRPMISKLSALGAE